MFGWRKRDQKEDDVVNDQGDVDIAKLQRQFGIDTVSDKDVEKEMQQLLGAMGNGEHSPTAQIFESLNSDEEEAAILRELQLSNDDDDVDTKEEEGLNEASVAERVQALKMEALELKKNGAVSESLAKFKEARELQVQSEKEASSRQDDNTDLDGTDGGEEDVELTEEDMQDPELLSQLASMGYADMSEKNQESTVEELEKQVQDAKVQAVMMKKENKIQEALEWLRKSKELEAQLKEMKAGDSGKDDEDQKEEEPSVYNTQLATHSPAEEEDVQVTEDDMNDPAYAEELSRLGLKAEPVQDLDGADVHSGSLGPSTSQYVPQRVSSVDDNDLIDAFESSDEEAEDPVEEKSSPVVEEPPQPEEEQNDEVRKLEQQLKDAKMSALELKRSGKTEEAVDMMRRVKQLQQLIQMKQNQPAPPVQSSADRQKFDELEKLLVKYANDAASQARECLQTNRARASELVNQRKEYVSALETLRQKRQNPLQPPPTYHIERTDVEQSVELTHIRENEIHVRLQSICDFAKVAGKDLFVKFSLNFPSSAPHEGATEAVTMPESPPHDVNLPEQVYRFPLNRTRGMQRVFEIKKASFEVWRQKSFFRSPELVAKGYQELRPLLSRCEVKGKVLFVGSSRKPTGGSIDMAISMRKPLRDKETRIIQIEKLVVGDYPDLKTPHPKETPIPPKETPLTPMPKAAISPAPPQKKKEVTKSEGQDDPHDLNLIVSYDVLTEELEKVSAKKASLPASQAMQLRGQVEALSQKKQALEADMEAGRLTLEMYIERLEKRIELDKILIKELMDQGRKEDAARVLHRVQVMEKEMQMDEEEEE